jgi:hypothetical protein
MAAARAARATEPGVARISRTLNRLIGIAGDRIPS